VTDPFERLRQPVPSVDPDPGFAAGLRARIERALALPRGVAMTTAITEPPTVSTAAEGAAIPYLAVATGSGRRALDWYARVLGAEPAGEPIMMDDGRVGHAELALAGGKLYLAEEFPEIGVVAPDAARTSVSLSLRVPDVADTVRRAVDAGGTLPRPMYDGYGSRNATIVDPFGHRWLLHTPLDTLPATDRQGDIGYAWLTVPDPDAAADFYAAVLGWQYQPGHAPGGRDVVGQSMPLGIGRGEPGWHLSWAVDDVAAAVARVRAAGGTAGDPEDRPYGTAADCADDQGTVFALHRAGGQARVPENGERAGDLAYVTVHTPDSARFRAFYGAVLGLRFEPGRIEDGWAVPGIAPMTGVAGGQATGTAVPMWKVADVAAAVARVRAAGGTGTDPERQPYGTTADCTDPQGVRFYLGDG
jgi:predicted enzyme related to lactoylglutathione lyase